MALILAILAYGRLIGLAPFGIGHAVRPAIELLISPIPYLAFSLLYRAIQSARP